MNKQQDALENVTVLDLTRVLAGPLCTQMLGDMGANIIKIEHPSRGDDTRHWGPPFADTEAAYFLGVNRNKKSLALDFKTPDGLKILKNLIKKSDVVIDNFKPGLLGKLGLTDDWFKTNANQVIRCPIYSSIEITFLPDCHKFTCWVCDHFRIQSTFFPF